MGSNFEQKQLAKTPKSQQRPAQEPAKSTQEASKGTLAHVRGQSMVNPWDGSVEWQRPAEEGGGGKPPLESGRNFVRCLTRRQGAADLMATPSFHRPLYVFRPFQGLLAATRGLLRTAWVASGASRETLGASWGVFGVSWELLVGSWGPLGGALGPSWAVFAAFRVLCGRFFASLGGSWGPSRGHLGATYRFSIDIISKIDPQNH